MKYIFTTLAAILLTASVFAQSPEKMSYQAVIRNSSDALVTNTQIGMQISILQGSTSGTAVYVETQTPTTNANGLVSVEIGEGTVLNGDFSSIDWANGSYFIKSETDPVGGTDYTIAGASQLLSVPYALHAKTAETVAEKNPVAELQTAEATGIKTAVATIGGSVNNNFGNIVLVKGICWGTSSNPTTSNQFTTEGMGSQPFSSSISGLIPNTLYYSRAYATTVAGTGYGNEITFTTNPLS